MPKSESIFISYRRSDSQPLADRIYDRLVHRFGRDHVFKDVDSIKPGENFAVRLDEAITSCKVALIVIGPTWVEVKNPDGTRRLDDPKDYVRREVEAALRRRGVQVIPVLVDGASVPSSSQLPSTLQKLPQNNVSLVGHDPRFHSDLDRLIGGLESQLGLPHVNLRTSGGQGSNKDSAPLDASFSEDLGSGITLEMIHIPGGIFRMGSPKDEEGRDGRESPQHRVIVPAFFMGMYPVTQLQWHSVSLYRKMPSSVRTFLKSTFLGGVAESVEMHLDSDPSYGKGDNRPVERVSWDDAIEFCARLSKRTGKDYRLPSEAEWEYACRAGTITPYHFDEEISEGLANYGNHCKGTIEVGKFGANAFGLHDMHGNVYEWCLDHWHDNYEGAPTDGSAWVTGGDSSRRVIRGGSWDSDPRACRSAYRDWSGPAVRNLRIGFRVCCSPPRTP